MSVEVELTGEKLGGMSLWIAVKCQSGSEIVSPKESQL